MIKQKDIKRTHLIQLLLVLIIILSANIISKSLFTRIDLTSEKRFTLSETTKNMLKSLKDVVYVKVYLEGDFPADFKRLKNATKELLDEFKAYSGDKIEYEFINPFENPDLKTQKEIYKELVSKGLEPVSINEKKEGGSAQKLLFPAAVLTFREKEAQVQIFRNQVGTSGAQSINGAIESLEFEFASAIQKLNTLIKPQISFITGQGELDKLATGDLVNSLTDFYEIRRTHIRETLNALDNKKAIIIAKPDSAFSEKDKYIIDQFIMKGGKVLWLIDPVFAEMDSLSNSNFTLCFPNKLNLDDQLFKYGVRINPVLVQDLSSAYIPVNVSPISAQPKFQMYPWFYFPVISPNGEHPITKNVGGIKFEFASTIDTIKSPGIKKTVLLRTSKYTKEINAPAKIGLDIVAKKPNVEEFNKSNLPVGVLLEGEFESVFKNRLPMDFVSSKEIAYRDKSVKNRMIIIADGDIIKNQVHRSTGQIYPLGYDKYTKITYANKSFILNAIDYLMNDEGLIKLRSRKIELRLLDKNEITKNRMKWQLINLLIPLFSIILFGVIFNYLRKRRYS